MPEEWIKGFLASLSEEKRQELAAKGVSDPAGWIASVFEGALSSRKNKAEGAKPEKRESYRDRRREVDRESFYRPVALYADEIAKEVRTESDRGVILIWHGNLDRLLANAFKRAFLTKRGDLDWIEELLDEDRGSLQSFHLKVKLAGVLGMLDAPTAKASLLLNTLRNRAAHRPVRFRLIESEVQPIRDALQGSDVASLDQLIEVFTMMWSALRSSRDKSSHVDAEAERVVEINGNPARIMLSAIVAVLYERYTAAKL